MAGTGDLVRQGRALGRARVGYRWAPAGTTTFLTPAEAAAVFPFVNAAITGSGTALMGGDGAALMSAHRKLDAGRSHVPPSPRLVHIPGGTGRA